MVQVDLIIFALLVTGLVFTIIELGLSAYIINITSNLYVSISTFNYLLFCSLWSLLVTGFLLVWASLARGKSPVAKTGSEKWLGPVTLALNFLTTVFWLAAFASLADLYNGYNVQGVAGAQLAFAVLLWLVFLALLILNFLTAFGVFRSERAGHSRMFSRARVDGVRTHNEVAEAPRTDVDFSDHH